MQETLFKNPFKKNATVVDIAYILILYNFI